MADDKQPPPLFPESDDVVDNEDEDLFATSAAVCHVSCLLLVVCAVEPHQSSQWAWPTTSVNHSSILHSLAIRAVQ